MSLNGNTNELQQVLDLAKSIEVPKKKSVFVQGGDFTEIASGTVIKKGQVVKFVVSEELSDDYYCAYGTNGEEISLINHVSLSTHGYGWKSTSSMGTPFLDDTAEVYIPYYGGKGEYSFVFEGSDITISNIDSGSNYINGYVGTPQKAVYEDNGEIKPLTTDMIEGNSGGSSVEVITVDDHDDNYESVWIPLKGHRRCYILPFERHNDGLTFFVQPIEKYLTSISANGVDTGENFTVVYHEDIDAFQISPIFYQGSGCPITVILFD